MNKHDVKKELARIGASDVANYFLARVIIRNNAGKEVSRYA